MPKVTQLMFGLLNSKAHVWATAPSIHRGKEGEAELAGDRDWFSILKKPTLKLPRLLLVFSYSFKFSEVKERWEIIILMEGVMSCKSFPSSAPLGPNLDPRVPIRIPDREVIPQLPTPPPLLGGHRLTAVLLATVYASFCPLSWLYGLLPPQRRCESPSMARSFYQLNTTKVLPRVKANVY